MFTCLIRFSTLLSLWVQGVGAGGGGGCKCVVASNAQKRLVVSCHACRGATAANKRVGVRLWSHLYTRCPQGVGGGSAAGVISIPPPPATLFAPTRMSLL